MVGRRADPLIADGTLDGLAKDTPVQGAGRAVRRAQHASIVRTSTQRRGDADAKARIQRTIQIRYRPAAIAKQTLSTRRWIPNLIWLLRLTKPELLSWAGRVLYGDNGRRGAHQLLELTR